MLIFSFFPCPFTVISFLLYERMTWGDDGGGDKQEKCDFFFFFQVMAISLGVHANIFHCLDFNKANAMYCQDCNV